MLKTIITLPNGTEISSGPGNINAIQKSKITEMVNSGEELTIGSVCSCSFEATLITPAGGLSVSAGDVITVHKEDENGSRIAIGLFTTEKPTRPTANTMKIVGYDHVSRLDKDLTEWLSGLTGWPYTLNTFAEMVCNACGLRFSAKVVPNASFAVNKFTRPSVTGRQIMRWLGEICCSFCRADPYGEIEFAWYTQKEIEIKPTGDLFYFKNSLTYEDYSTEPIEMIQIRLADSENGALFPTVEEGTNSYIISGNPFMTSSLTEDFLKTVINQIATRLIHVSYTPCKVKIPSTTNIHAGDILQITDINGVAITAYVMTKTQDGQLETLECTGSARRDGSSALSNMTQYDKNAALEQYANSAASKAVNSQTAEQIFNKLTNNGEIKGLLVEDNVWVLNADVAKIVNLIAEKLKSADGNNELTITGSEAKMTADKKETLWIANLGERAYLYFTAYDDDTGRESARGQYGATRMQIGGTWADPILKFEVRDNVPYLQIGDDMKRISWKNNGDGTYSLVGTNS